MKKYLYVVLIIAILISCRKTSTNEKYYLDDDYPALKIKESKNGERILYYPSGQIFAVGKVNKKGLRDGWWDYFNEEGKLVESRDYKIIEDKEVANQWIYFNETGKKIFKAESGNRVSLQFSKYREFIDEKTFYADILVVNDTISLGEPFRAVGIYYTPVFADKNSSLIVVLDKSEMFIRNSNLKNKEIKKDTFYSLSKDTINIKWFPEDDPDYTVVFGGWFKTTGAKTISGYFSEFYTDSQNQHHEKKIYFKKEIFVKDSL